jgi:putative hydrolase of the HAD superfamily
LGVLSDAWLGTRDRVQEWVNYDLFDVIMFSAEEGVRKPDPEMYQRMLSRLGVNAKEAIFIDDRADNIDGARAVGMYGIHYTPDIDIKMAIEEIAG